ncbi:MAG: hypothetical protein AB8B74_03290 [Crocinitomicaceae bacterium]
MKESDLFNKDTMYWREVNFSLPSALAEIELSEAIDVGTEVEIEFVEAINCYLLPFEAHEVEYQMENGGSFLKKEVKAWPFVFLADLEFYLDESNSEEARNGKLKSVLHDNVKAIIKKKKKGQVVLRKGKV